jgi:hypothetical protein
MSCWLKQSTAVDVMLGPFLDSVDGNTVEGGLTITQPDIRLSKNGGAFAQKSAAQTLTHGENGWYPANLSTTDTNTLGVLVVAVHESGALPVWREFLVVPANVYDSFFSTDLLQVDVTQWTGSTPTGLNSGKVQSLVTSMSPSAIDSAAFAAGAINAAAIASGAIDDDALATDVDTYQAKIGLLDDNGGTADRYTVMWFRNGTWIQSGITLPEIQVYKIADGTDLIAETAMTEIGSTQTFRFIESTNRVVSGVGYIAVASATIDGSIRKWPEVVGRDS